MEANELIYGQGDIQSVLKRIGVNKSNVFCVGEDPVMKSGVIVSLGKIVSSKILDITIKSGKNNIVMSSTDSYINKVIVKYVNAETKRIDTQAFSILNDEALIEIISIIKNFNDVQEKVQNIEEKLRNFDEKLLKFDSFLNENENQVRSIGGIKDQICVLENKLDIIMRNMHI